MQAFTTCFAVSMQLYRPRHKTAHRALQRLFLRLRPFNRPRYQTDTSGYNTACATLGRYTGQHRPPIIIRYIRECRGSSLSWFYARRRSTSQTVPVAAGQLLPCADRWQVLTVCQQYRPGAPAEGSASPPVYGQPGGDSILPTPGDWRSGTGSAVQGVRSGTLHPAGQSSGKGRGGRRGTIGGFRRSSFRAFAR